MMGTWMGLGNHDPGNRARIKYFHPKYIWIEFLLKTSYYPSPLKQERTIKELRNHKYKKVLKRKSFLDLETHLTRKLLPSARCLSLQVPEYQRRAVKL